MPRPLVTSALFIILLSGTVNADVFRILEDDREAAQARVDLIQQAKHEIHGVYFLARNDRITLCSLALLRDARRRGVGSVKLIADANFQHIPKAVLAHLREEGVEIKVYHPMDLRHPSWLFRRMHEKVIVADAQRYIAGGRNLGEAYFGLAKHNFVDRDVYIEGDSAAEVDAHFDELWNSTEVTALRVRVSREQRRRAAVLLDDVLQQLQCEKFIALNTGYDWSQGQRQVPPVRFVHDSPAGTDPRVGTRLIDMLNGAQESIVIESPYLVPTHNTYEVLKSKARQGVNITIITNSLRSTDGVLPHAGYVKYRRRFLHAGIDLREYKGPHTLHAKSIVIDGKTAIVGSYNIDPRSENLNSEVLCVVDDEEAAAKLREQIDQHMHNSWAVAFRRPHDRVSHVRAFFVRAARLLLPVVEGQL